jgi:hypothetical protein
MAPQIVKLGTADAHRVAVVVVICRDVLVGAGVQHVAMATIEGAYAFWLFSSACHI